MLSWCGLCSGGCQADGFKGSMEFLAERDVMLIQGIVDFGWATARTHDAGQQRLDDLLAQEEVGTEGPHSGRIDGVATRPLDPMEERLAAQFCHVVGRVACRISCISWNSI